MIFEHLRKFSSSAKSVIVKLIIGYDLDKLDLYANTFKTFITTQRFVIVPKSVNHRGSYNWQ